MIHPYQHISDLAEILLRLGIEDVIISPGSRNAPLINAFFEKFGEKCKSIVDERSAAYFALGKSLFSKKPTVLICTSGTAALNYAPAVAEAFFQGIPLIILTADRPPELIGHQDNQSIYQENLYGKNVKASFVFPDSMTEKNLNSSWKIINQAYSLSISDRLGPVHINIPLREPLYGKIPECSENLITEKHQITLNQVLPGNFLLDWNQAKSIMIVCGQHQPDPELAQSILKIKKDPRVIVLAEPISNLHFTADIYSPDLIITNNPLPEKFNPEMIIYFGGQVVSKKLKEYLRQLNQSSFYFLENSSRIIDTFQNLKATIRAIPANVFKKLSIREGEDINFKKSWIHANKEIISKSEEYLTGLSGFSDLQVFNFLSNELTKDATIFSGNSSVVRYLLYFKQRNRIIHANRGTSGIDGSLSTAAGYASSASETVYAILGDLSFLYDSNALWNRELPYNLKIIVINNEGGGIFHLIDGPKISKAFKPFIDAYHPVKINKLAEAYRIAYYFCDNIVNLAIGLKLLSESEKTFILEIKTSNKINSEITKKFFEYIKK